jgi:hypothetical protein
MSMDIQDYLSEKDLGAHDRVIDDQLQLMFNQVQMCLPQSMRDLKTMRQLASHVLVMCKFHNTLTVILNATMPLRGPSLKVIGIIDPKSGHHSYACTIDMLSSNIATIRPVKYPSSFRSRYDDLTGEQKITLFDPRFETSECDVFIPPSVMDQETNFVCVGSNSLPLVAKLYLPDIFVIHVSGQSVPSVLTLLLQSLIDVENDNCQMVCVVFGKYHFVELFIREMLCPNVGFIIGRAKQSCTLKLKTRLSNIGIQHFQIEEWARANQ